MSIKVIFPPGATRLSVNGLHQWDYGRKIEIHADDLPPLVEVHFACDGMEEAVVRSCAVIDGVAEAAVPDQCLEQTTPVTAWVYEVGETSGETVKTIILPITPRTKPQPGATVPQDVSDKYTEAVAAMTELVAECEQALQKVPETLYSEGWKAKYAETADKAKKDSLGYPLDNLLRGTFNGFTQYTAGTEIAGGFMAFRVVSVGAMDVRILTEVGGRLTTCYSPVFYWYGKDTHFPARLKFTHVGADEYTITAELFTEGGGWSGDGFSPDIYYQRLSSSYPVG